MFLECHLNSAKAITDHPACWRQQVCPTVNNYCIRSFLRRDVVDLVTLRLELLILFGVNCNNRALEQFIWMNSQGYIHGPIYGKTGGRRRPTSLIYTLENDKTQLDKPRYGWADKTCLSSDGCLGWSDIPARKNQVTSPFPTPTGAHGFRSAWQKTYLLYFVPTVLAVEENIEARDVYLNLWPRSNVAYQRPAPLSRTSICCIVLCTLCTICTDHREEIATDVAGKHINYIFGKTVMELN